MFLHEGLRLISNVRSKYLNHKVLEHYSRWEQHDIDWATLKAGALSYARSLKVYPDIHNHEYRYSAFQKSPSLYASTYVVLLYDIFGYVKELPQAVKDSWIDFLRQFQDEGDGLFKDPLIACKNAETEDWWGWRHLTVHVLMALAVLGTRPNNPVFYVQQFNTLDFLKSYLESKNWGQQVSFTSNEIQNLGVFLQYNRDVFNDEKSAQMLEVLYNVLDRKQCPKTGLYGASFDRPDLISEGVQAGYHLWLLYFYDKRPIQYKKQIIDSLLNTQNILGGFGVKLNSSACEDIDSIDPMIRLSCQTSYRAEDIRKVIIKAKKWMLFNRNQNGSFVFRREEGWKYGHRVMYSPANSGSLFATWFRCLCLKYIDCFLANPEAQHFGAHCPGVQFSSES